MGINLMSDSYYRVWVSYDSHYMKDECLAREETQAEAESALHRHKGIKEGGQITKVMFITHRNKVIMKTDPFS